MSAAWWRKRSPAGGAGQPDERPADPGELLLRHAGALRDIVAAFAELNRLSAEEADDLEAAVGARLTANDFEALRDFRGRTAFATYLHVVVGRLVAQHRDELWERWRREAASAGHARAAAELERLVYDEALSPEEALEAVGAVYASPAQRAGLEALWRARPWHGKRPVTDLKWEHRAAEPQPPSTRQLTVLERQLATALRELPAENRLLLQVRFSSQLSDEAIARWQHRSPAEVSRRIEAILKGLRQRLSSMGVEVLDMGALLANPRPGRVPPMGENGRAWPSNQADMPDKPTDGD